MYRPAVLSILIFLILFFSCGSTGEENVNQIQPENPKVLVIVPRYVGLNYYFQLDTFSQYGWDITLAGVTDSVQICPPVAQQTPLKPIKTDVIIVAFP